jgi:hypothetical protein
MTLRTDEALEAALDLLTAEENLSRQEVVRRAIIDRAENVRRRRTISDLTDEALTDWAETLDRLGRE